MFRSVWSAVTAVVHTTPCSKKNEAPKFWP